MFYMWKLWVNGLVSKNSQSSCVWRDHNKNCFFVFFFFFQQCVQPCNQSRSRYWKEKSESMEIKHNSRTTCAMERISEGRLSGRSTTHSRGIIHTLWVRSSDGMSILLFLWPWGQVFLEWEANVMDLNRNRFEKEVWD